MVSALTQALMGAQFGAEESPWGIGAMALGQSAPLLYNPYKSTGTNLAYTLGAGIVTGLLGGLARRDAATRNAELYDAYSKFSTADPELRSSILKENPRLGSVALALAADERDTQRSIREKMADNLIRSQGMGGYGQSLDTNSLADYIMSGKMPAGGFNAEDRMSSTNAVTAVDPNAADVIRGSEFLPETPEQFSERIKRAELASGMSTPARAADFAKQEVKREYGDLAKLRENIAKEKASTADAIASIATMEQELPNLGNAGPIREALLNPTRVVASMFGDDKTKSELAARSRYLNASQSLTQEAVKGLAPVSNSDMQIAASSVGSLREGTTVPEAKAIIERMKPLKENRLQYESELSKWVEKYRTDKGFAQAYDQYKEEEPIFSSSGKVRSRPQFKDWFNSPKNKNLKEAASNAASQDAGMGGAEVEKKRALINSITSMQSQIRGLR
jgi:hypothetical protein